jgi:hypothetical protein
MYVDSNMSGRENTRTGRDRRDSEKDSVALMYWESVGGLLRNKRAFERRLKYDGSHRGWHLHSAGVVQMVLSLRENERACFLNASLSNKAEVPSGYQRRGLGPGFLDETVDAETGRCEC